MILSYRNNIFGEQRTPFSRSFCRPDQFADGRNQFINRFKCAGRFTIFWAEPAINVGNVDKKASQLTEEALVFTMHTNPEPGYRITIHNPNSSIPPGNPNRPDIFITIDTLEVQRRMEWILRP